jgi:ATP synthase protein I
MTGDHIDDLEKRLHDAKEDYKAEYEPKSTDEKSMNDGARAGVELVGATLGGGLIGWGLDRFFETSPICFLIFIILGVITGFYNVYKITQNIGTSVGFKQLHDREKNAKQAPENTNLNNDED